jgi:hypothetical protein
MAAIDDLLVKVGELGQVLKDLEETRSRILGYRDQRQTLAGYIDQETAKRDLLVESSKAKLQELADAINTALPRA